MEEPPELVPIEPKTRVPVTIITGFLGAGKTTFLRHVLTCNHGKRIAVIQNEFGEEVELGEALVLDANVVAVSMPNGCICCNVKDDLLIGVERIVSSAEKIDHVFIECSGLADPGQVAGMFWTDEALDSIVYLDGIITLVDGKHFLQDLKKDRAFEYLYQVERQLAYADVILLNKMDLVDETGLQMLMTAVREINAGAPIHKTCRGVTENLSVLLNIRTLERLTEPSLGKNIGNTKHQHKHDSTVTTVSLSVDGCISSINGMERWLGEILWNDSVANRENEMDIFRCKGIVAVAGEKNRYMLQGVHQLFSIEETEVPWDQNPRIRLVFIGKNLKKEVLQAQLNELAAAK